MAQDFEQNDAQDLRRIDFSHEEDKFFEVFDFYCTTVLPSQAQDPTLLRSFAEGGRYFL